VNPAEYLAAPVAGWPPMAPSDVSTWRTPSSSMAIEFAIPVPRVSWKWAMNSAPGKVDRSCPTRSRT